MSFGKFFCGGIAIIAILAMLPTLGKSPAQLEAYGKRLQVLGKSITSFFIALVFLFLLYIVASALLSQ